jgi:tetratricopeptide (TPR) repeat protein
MRNILLASGAFLVALAAALTILYLTTPSTPFAERVLLLMAQAGIPTPVQQESAVRNPATPGERSSAALSPTPTMTFRKPGPSALVPNVPQTAQTFNNCGPATLSMIMTWAGTPKDQYELGALMRPYSNPQGDNDDKSVSSDEFVEWARTFGLYAERRPNGTLEMLKTFNANGIAIAVKSWLHPNEDIGHFRIIKGYDDTTRLLTQDDSFDGPNLTIGYDEFMAMWQPFNYEYYIIVRPDQQALAEAIIGEDRDETTAWRNAIVRADRELADNPDAVYPIFNKSVAYYHLGDNTRTIEEFEKVESRLPSRMLWYQIEPLRAYAALGNEARVYELSEQIMGTENRSNSEMYVLRGNLMKARGDGTGARAQYELALQYNVNSREVKEALASLETEPAR